MIYRDFEKVINNCYNLMGSGIGLAKPNFVSGGKNASNIVLSVQQLNLPDYHKVMFNSTQDASYHIAGYGQSNEEAITRALGETIERFSFMSMFFLFKDKLIKASYNELKETNKNVLPLSYINIIKENSIYKDILPNEPISWIELKNYSDDLSWFYPFCFIGAEKSMQAHVFPTMSTGTATHITKEKALKNALIEKLQIHLFLTAWYQQKKLPVVSWENNCSQAFNNIIKKTFPDLSKFDIIVLDCGLPEVCFHNYITILKGKQTYPAFAIGVQGGFDPEETLLRSMMEASSIYVNLQSFYLFQKDMINSLTKDNILQRYDLDAPFLYWSNFNDYEVKESFLDKISDNEKIINFSKVECISDFEKQLRILFSFFKKTLNFFSVIDITSPDTQKYGYHTVRVIAPELISMNFSGCTYDRHPYFLNTGGITNEYLSQPLP